VCRRAAEKHIPTKDLLNVAGRPFRFGERLDEQQFVGARCFVHFSWTRHKTGHPATTSNLDASSQFVEMCRRWGIPYVFVSSIAAAFPDRSQYGWEKHKVEHLLAQTMSTTVRPGLVWDENPFGQLRKLVKWLNLLPFDIRVDDVPIRLQMIHVDDLVELILSEALRLAERSPRSRFEVVDAFHQEGVTIAQLRDKYAIRKASVNLNFRTAHLLMLRDLNSRFRISVLEQIMNILSTPILAPRTPTNNLRSFK